MHLRSLFLAFLGLCVLAPFPGRAEITPPEQKKAPPLFIDMRGVAGSYLAGRFAQTHHDWNRAAEYLGNVLKTDPENTDLLRRLMVLAMGAGQVETALAIADKIGTADEQTGSLVLLFLSLEDFKAQNYADAAKHLGAMTPGGISEFLTSMLEAWAQAGTGKFAVEKLPDNSLGAYHAVLIAYSLGKTEKISALAKSATGAQGLPAHDLERIADICLAAGSRDQALEIYKDLQAERTDDPAFARKIAAIEAQGTDKGLSSRSKEKSSAIADPAIPSPPVLTAQQGAAEALFDMAGLLFGEYSDDSARIFAQMSLYLDPGLDESRVLLAHIAARNERYDEAIRYFQAIRRDDEDWLDAQRRAADLMERAGRRADALGLLNMLVKERQDLDSQIQIGDLHRRAGELALALEAYNRAIQQLGGKIPSEDWNILYARGMVYEQLGQWKEAERDLLAALTYQPEHPYILNALGYGWAERGENLDRALSMLEKAATLRPSDEYISDSLGWALYRLGRYADAVAPMEKAVGMLPGDSLVNDHLGDVYWRVGRTREARFQWERALNASEDAAASATISEKLRNGLPPLAGSTAGVPASPAPAPAAPAPVPAPALSPVQPPVH